MDRGDGGDDGEVGPDDFRAHAEFSRHAHPGLDDGETVPSGLQAQEHQRDTQQVIEVGFGDEGGRAEQRPEQVLRGGLADAAGHADDGTGETSAPGGGGGAQGGGRIGDDELGQCIGHRVADEGASGALGAGGGQEIVAVATVRADRDKGVAGAQGPRVRAEAGDGGGRGRPAPGGPGGEVGGGEGGHHAEAPLLASRISRTT